MRMWHDKKTQKHLGLPIDSKLDFNEDIDKKIK